jgi:ribosome assembly protein RRB1
MSKRAAEDHPSTSGSPYAKVPAGAPRREPAAPDEMGEFEDAFEDEIESDEDAVDGDEDGVCASSCIIEATRGAERTGQAWM